MGKARPAQSLFHPVELAVLGREGVRPTNIAAAGTWGEARSNLPVLGKHVQSYSERRRGSRKTPALFSGMLSDNNKEQKS